MTARSRVEGTPAREGQPRLLKHPPVRFSWRREVASDRSASKLILRSNQEKSFSTVSAMTAATISRGLNQNHPSAFSCTGPRDRQDHARPSYRPKARRHTVEAQRPRDGPVEIRGSGERDSSNLREGGGERAGGDCD